MRSWHSECWIRINGARQAGAPVRGHKEAANPGARGHRGLKGPDENTAVMQDFGLTDHSGRQKVVRILS